MDSLIRLRQINQTDLSGYVGQIFAPILQSNGLTLSGQSLLPSGSGIFDLGSVNRTFDQVYSNGLYVPSGSGIYFGTTYLTAYTSGSNAVVKVGPYTLLSSPSGLSIMGPQGPTGATGLIGASGASGIGITGAVISGSNYLRLLFSNGLTGNPISLPSGATGVSGASVTGFYQSGVFVRPMFSNGTSGNLFPLPTGVPGSQGPVGGITMSCGQMTGYLTGQVYPDVVIPNIDPNSNNGHNPTIRMVKGMRYTIAVSGINIGTYVSDGTYIPIGTYHTNIFVDEQGSTGYLRFAVWDSATPDYGFTGRMVYPESSLNYATLASYNKDSELMTNIYEDAYHGSISFNVNFGSQDSYKWGFMRYNMDGSVNNGSVANTWGGYVLGTLSTSYFGPSGPSGTSGPRGLDGPQGEPGPVGEGGGEGIGVTGVERNSLDTTQIRFLFSDNTNSEWVTLPAGGAQGPKGDTGPQGDKGDDGSPGPQGDKGDKGDQGAGDSYMSNFASSDINATSGITPSFNKMTSGLSYWTYTTGYNNLWLNPGDAFQFQHNSIKNKAYTPWQNLIFADNNYTGTRYFYAQVMNYNSTAGILSAVVTNSPYAPVGMSGGHIYWSQYNMVALNLGGLGSPGQSGAIGQQGIQGVPGDTGNTIFNIKVSGVTPSIFNYLDCVTNSAFDLTLGSPGNYSYYDNFIYFNTSRFSTGQTVQIKLSNNGPLTPNDGLMVHWDTYTKFPNSVPGPAPQPNTTNIFTFVRYPDKAGVPQIFCTYSYNYPL